MPGAVGRNRIVVIPSWYPSAQTPLTGIFVRDQAACLARRFDVTVLTPRFPTSADLLRLRWGPRLSEESDQGIRVWRIRHLKIPTLRRWLPWFRTPDHVLVFYRKFFAAIHRGFAAYVRRHGVPDAIHAHVVLPAGWVAVALGREHGVPVVLTEHSGPFAMHLASAGQRTLVHDILTGADRVVAVSAALRAGMHAFCPEARIDVVGNIIPTEYFTPGPVTAPGTKPFRFFMLALLSEEKGVRYLLEALPILRAQGFTQFEVVVGGDGPCRPAFENLADRLGVTKSCVFLGMLNREQVREQMRACDAFVLPSLGETFGVVLGEAMACGKPVLATRCGGPEEVVTPETGLLVAPGDAAALADGMTAFLTRQVSFAADRIRASVVRRYGEQAFVEHMARLYAEVGQHSPHAAARRSRRVA